MGKLTLDLYRATVTKANVNLTEGSATPSELVQNFYPAEDSDGFSKFIVYGIPANYKDISEVTAVAEDVRNGKKIIISDGELVGTLAEVTAEQTVLDCENTEHTIPEGIHTGEGTVSIVTQEKTATANGEVTADSGNVLSKVTVNVPKIVDLQNKTATPTESQQTVEADAEYDGLGTVTVNAIQTEEKSATPSESEQNIVPTEGKYLKKVTVNAIPNNYEIPVIYDGSTNVIPSTEIQTLPTNGKKLTSDITIQASQGNPDDTVALKNIIDRTILNIDVPMGATSIGASSFSYCQSLKTINMPNSVKSIGTYAFNHCESLISINISTSATILDNYAFSYCQSLKTINIPNSVKSIGAYTFWTCSSLKAIEIPNSVTSISSSAFTNCTALTSIKVPWTEGAVAAAPWGATKATITYNYTGEAE